MSQTTLDDDDLFSEAASEVRADVEAALADARSALPDADAIWEIEAENSLGVLNGLRSALDTEGAAAHLKEAKKWYTMGQRADAFDDGGDLAEEIETVEALFDQIEAAHTQVSEVAATLPELRSALEDASEDAN